MREALARLPDKPGVYVYRDARGQVIYVGKAGSLRSRVRSYWHASRADEGKVAVLVRQVASIETIVCANEVEALVLESNLIKRHRPRYNVRLRDDKQYPWLRIDPREPWPRLQLVRNRRDDGARYFGPFTDATAVRQTMSILRRAFPYRTCSDRRLRQGGRPCLYYHIGRCPAPCVGYVDEAAYARTVGQLVAFLEGQDASVLGELERQMQDAAESLAFERAAELRDRIRALAALREGQNAVLRTVADRDLVAIAREGDLAVAQVFFVREGRVEGGASFVLDAGLAGSPGEILAAFLKQYYEGGAPVPREVLVDVEPDVGEVRALAAYLAERRGARVTIRRPRRGEARRLMERVRENARERLAAELWRRDRAEAGAEEAMAELARVLGLAGPPRRIECYDVSNVQGSHIVAAMTVAEDGRLAPGEYRRFRIQSVVGRPDDFQSLREVLGRRFRRALAARAAAEGGPRPEGADAKWARLPDLVVIDGGRGQLSAALTVLRSLGLGDLPAIALAKGEELVFRPGDPRPLALPRESAALRLLQQVRDEAHRFGVAYHRSLRSQGALRSLLDEIPGVGPRRRRALVRAFGSAEAIVAAGPEAVAAVPGIPRALAERIVEHLTREMR
ncbi:MAG: excinuclease ABC subunit UvrC [Clostridia bacterium]|nr:excinuclease ABC subunit UvrC [Clostridia bacterium]